MKFSINHSFSKCDQSKGNVLGPFTRNCKGIVNIWSNNLVLLIKNDSCNSLNVKPSNSQHHKSNVAVKNETEAVFRLPSNIIGNANDETNFPINYY